MISAHGATVTVSNTAVIVSPTALAASLRGDSAPRTVDIDQVEGATSTSGDAWSPSRVEIATTAGPVVVEFPPGDTAGAQELVALIDAALQGNAPADSVDGAAGIPGFSFVALDVETANQNWGSICQIGVVKIVDGEEVDRTSWTCAPPAGIDEFDPFNVDIHGITAEAVANCPNVGEIMDEVAEFIGELPMVAHNAQFDASALRYACVAAKREVPKIMFACTLAQARATTLDVANHRLPTLAEHFGVALDAHHDAEADAAACAGIMLGLARQANYEGSLLGFVHDAGFALGSIDTDRVTPVLLDRSGATRALQAKRVAEDGMAAAVGAVAAPRGSNQAGPKKQPRNQWQAVSTPDTVPEPAADADPDSALYGQHVTLTGDFEPFDKGELWDGIAAQGGQVGKNVTKKTTILVAGTWATMTSKEKRARELQEQGQDIQVWTADQLLEVLGFDG